MAWDKLHFAKAVFSFFLPYSLTFIRQQVSALIHKRTYKLVPETEIKNVVVVGGSFAGVQIAKRLSQTLPTGYRVVLIEKNSHLNYLFLFPRFSVIKGYEKYAFIPYDGLGKYGPKGIFKHVQDTATNITSSHIELGSGNKVEYAYLVIATGTSSPLPSKLASTERQSAMAELVAMQNTITDAKKIAVVGGGAVGVELTSDIKSFYPEKEIVLIHSRGQLMQSFGRRLHDHTMKVFGELGIPVLLNERPKIPAENNTLTLLNGKEEQFDLIIPCTGQRPNSSIIANLSPSSISKANSRILVEPTLQLVDSKFPNVFAFGDVAETGGPKMARAAHFQCEVVISNILSLIKGDQNLKNYKPVVSIEGSIKLTLGKDRIAFYLQEENGRESLIAVGYKKMDLGIKGQWRFFGADVKTVENEEKENTKMISVA